jgi:hypothetical protein
MSAAAPSTELLQALQDAIKAHLETMAELHGRTIPVITRDLGKIETLIEQQCAQVGCCLVVWPPDGFVESPNIKGPFFDRIEIQVTAYDNPEVTRERHPGYTALILAQLALRRLHHWKPPVQANKFLVARPGPNPVPNDDPDLNAVDAFFRTSGGLDPMN